MQDAKGEFTYNLGLPKREAIVGRDGIHGFKETPQVAYVEGSITDRGTLDVAALAKGTGLTITLQLANGKTIVLGNAYFAADGAIKTDEAEIEVRWEGSSPAKEITA